MAITQSTTLNSPIDVAEYLFRRLHQLGIRSVHGLPGDFNLVALDYLPKCGLNWIGSVNELNAAYAADGYARIKGMAAVVTTFGVGELSAVNGIAGAFAENVPVVHIVGQPSTLSQREGALLHHTLGDGKFDTFELIGAQVACHVARLDTPSEITQRIDDALCQCWFQSKPVYISLPTDMVQVKIEGERLQIPLNLSEPLNDAKAQAQVVDQIMEQFKSACQPVIVVDALASRHRALQETREFIQASNLPCFVTPMGKSSVNEDGPTFRGIYAGDGSFPSEVKDIVESSDLIFLIGSFQGDLNTAGFSHLIKQDNTVEINWDSCMVKSSLHSGLMMKELLRVLSIKLASVTFSSQIDDCTLVRDEYGRPADPTITHTWFWHRLSQFLHEGDILITETGTANFGLWTTALPPNVAAINQLHWGSIGWSVGACQGAALAAKDLGTRRRTILLVGDCSFQLSAQELSTIIGQGLSPIIFILCNEGMTVERHIHGRKASYNDIRSWRHEALLSVFNAEESSRFWAVKTNEELEGLFENKELGAAEKLQLVEVYMPKEDAPQALMITARALADRASSKRTVQKVEI